MRKKASLLIGIGILFATIALSSPENLLRSVAGFERSLILPVAALSLANYFSRFIRWDMLISNSGVKMRAGENILVFFSSFLFAIAPAKSGDLVKAYYLKERHKTGYSVTVPVIFLERAYDVLGIVLLLAVSLADYFHELAYISAALILLVLFGTIFFRQIADFFLSRFRPPVFRREARLLKRSLLRSKKIFSLKMSFASLFLGTLAWFFECLGLYLVVLGFGISPELMRETLIYSASTLGGAASMLPGGIGATEGGMSVLLSKIALVPFSEAVSITLVIRAFTLWLAVALGFFANLLIARTKPR